MLSFLLPDNEVSGSQKYLLSYRTVVETFQKKKSKKKEKKEERKKKRKRQKTKAMLSDPQRLLTKK